jgi:histidine triad (HIT) family protein
LVELLSLVLYLPAMTGCVFCAIIAGDPPASRVYEDDAVLAFLDRAPITPGHTLVVPKHHADGLAELPSELGASMWRVGQRLAAALRQADLHCEGVNFLLADGQAAGQEVFHVHLHVFPRYPGDGLQMTADWGNPDRGELDATAEMLSRALRSRRSVRDQTHPDLP